MAYPGTATDILASGPTHTLRVTFAYRGAEIALTGSRRVRMVAPPPVTPPPEKGQTGYWFEVRAADGTLLFHRALHEPIRADVEVYTGDRRHSVQRAPLAAPQGEFEVLVPDLPGAAAFVLHGPPADARLQAVPSRELVRIGFDELRKPPPGTPGPEQRPPTGGGPKS